MRAFLLPLALTFTALCSTSLAREPYVPCDLAVKLDYGTYLPVAVANLGGWSEASEDDAAGWYAECQEKALTASLSKSPNLRTRVATLRKLLRQLRSQESGIASMLAGGGTMYSHAIPRSYVDVELFLKSLAALASDSYGGLNASRGATQLKEADAALAARLKKLRALRPTDTLKLLNITLADYRKAIDEYEKTYKSIVAIVGRKADIATVATHDFISQPLFVDEALND